MIFHHDEFAEIVEQDMPDHYAWPKCPYCGVAYESPRALDDCMEMCAKAAITFKRLCGG